MEEVAHRGRLSAQLLAGTPAPSAEAVVEHLLAVQAQDPRGMRLAVRARSTGLRAADVDAALGERRLVVSWLNRGTLHLVAADDLPWLHALTTPQLAAGNRRRLAQEGVSAEQADLGVRVVEQALRSGPATREVLRERLAVAGVPVAGQAVPHVLLRATLHGVCVRGPVVDGEQAFVLRQEWLAEATPPDRDEALRELAVRYLRGHGPGADRDLARWAGLPLRDVRRGLSLAGSRLVERDGLVDLRSRRPVADLPPPRLLGAFDPLLLGWTSRDDVVGRHRSLVTSNGIFRPFALVAGRAVALWRYARGQVRVEPLEPLDDGVLAALRADGEDVERFLA